MTEEEAKAALFEVHKWYMMHGPKEREKLYDEYKEKRAAIRHELGRIKREKIEAEESKKNNR